MAEVHMFVTFPSTLIIDEGNRREKFDMQLNYIHVYTFYTKYCFQIVKRCL
jgi:hypothetical protein